MQQSLLKRKDKGVCKRRQKESFPDSCAWSRSLMTKASSPQQWTKWLSAVVDQVYQQSHKWVSDYTSDSAIAQVSQWFTQVSQWSHKWQLTQSVVMVRGMWNEKLVVTGHSGHSRWTTLCSTCLGGGAEKLISDNLQKIFTSWVFHRGRVNF